MSARPASSPGRFLCIGTHHKTGTVWLRKVMHAISNDQGIPLIKMYRARRMGDLPETGPQIVVNWSSTFPQEMLDHPEARFIHMIRDPRDILLSGMRYHRVAGLNKEKFLRIPMPELVGMNYQDYLNQLPNEHERLLFEMRHKHTQTVAEMTAWKYHAPNVVEFRYEDLIADTNCVAFRNMLEKFQIVGLDIDRAMRSFWDNSLFGGFAKTENRAGELDVHISAAAGQPAQWRSKMSREIAEIYVREFGKDLKALKYAKNNYWVKDCTPAAEMSVNAG